MNVTIADRAAAVQAELDREGFAALLVLAPPNLEYVSGFRATPFERLIALVVAGDGPLRLVVPSLEDEAARAAVAPETALHVWRDEEGPAAALAAALEGLRGRIGVEKSYLTVAFYELAASCLPPDASLEDCGPLLARLRSVKDADEVAQLAEAGRIVDTVVARLAAEELRPGRTEAELSALTALLLRRAGADALAFDPLVLTGPKSALPHGRPDGTPLEAGDLVIVDIGARSGGYCADISRTFVVGGEPDARQRELFAVVREAQLAGVRAATAGTACADVDRAARRVIEEAGFGERFVHRTGHGLGLEPHEPPYLTSTNEESLVEGMVVTVEPGIYVEGYGGVRIEDDLVVRAGEPELLTNAPIRLELG
jgi:Xaa-Pro dipeptidase